MVNAVRKIVVIDDNRDLLYTIRTYLAAYGHIVWAEVGGPAGVQRIAAERPDLAFCDLNLPRFDGYHIARSIRGDAGLAQVRLIAMTADSDTLCSRRAKAAGFETTLIKPVPLVEMLCLAEMPLRASAWIPGSPAASYDPTANQSALRAV